MPTAHAGELTAEEQRRRARAHLDAAQDDMHKAGQHVVCEHVTTRPPSCGKCAGGSPPATQSRHDSRELCGVAGERYADCGARCSFCCGSGGPGRVAHRTQVRPHLVGRHRVQQLRVLYCACS